MGAYEGWEDEAARRPTDVLKFVKESLQTRPSGTELPQTHPAQFIASNLEAMLQVGRVCLIFDALDEMPQDSYQERYQALKEFMVMWEGFGDNRFIYSCRILDYDPSFSVDEVIIDRFDRARISNFLKQHAPVVARDLYKRIIDDEALEELVSNPFFLQALAYINMVYPADTRAPNPLWLPASRGELLKEFIEQLLEREAGIKQRKYLESVEGGLDTLRRFLSELAFTLQERKEGRTSAQTGSLYAIWQKYPQWQRLIWISRRARILGKRGEPAHDIVDTVPPNVTPPERIEFIHHRLQEFFAAEELARRLAAGEALSRYLEDIWWQETVVFAVGLIEEPQSIISRMLATRAETDEWVGVVLALAKDPLRKENEKDAEGDEETVSAAVEGRHQNVQAD
jgi:predicted NACHT family NTPase